MGEKAAVRRTVLHEAEPRQAEEALLEPGGTDEYPIQLTIHNNGRGAAHRAARAGNVGMLYAMKELRCPMAQKDYRGWLATPVAAQEGHI